MTDDYKKITATILFADIKGFSRLTLPQKLMLRRRVEPEAMDRIKRALGAETPIHFNSWGDAYLLVFSNVAAGTKAAFELRDGFLARADWNDMGFPSSLSIRCALHVGDIVVESFPNPFGGPDRTDVIGDNIDLTARIEPVTEPGRIWATDTAVSHIRGNASLVGIEFDSLGRRPLAKGWQPRPLYDLRRTLDKSLQLQKLLPELSPIKHVLAVDIRHRAQPKRTLFIVAGPSAVGKDAVASRLRGRLTELGVQARFADKYTTRKKRADETTAQADPWHDPSSRYTHVETVEEFEANQDIVGRYEKYGDFYGFSKKHLSSSRRSDSVVICIYGDLRTIDDFVQHVEEQYKRDALVFLLNAPREELDRRLDTRRGMDVETILIRKAEMMSDVAVIRRIQLNTRDYVVVANANVDNPDDVAERLLKEMLKYLDILIKE